MIKFFYVGILFFVAGCASQMPVRTPASSVALKSPTKIERVEIKSVTKQYRAVSDQPVDTRDNYTLRVELGHLSEADFTAYREAFRTQDLTYDSAKVYRLEDFFPPFAQALLEKFVPSGSKIAPRVQKSELTALQAWMHKEEMNMKSSNPFFSANCHSFTWQWLHFLSAVDSEPAAVVFNAQRYAIPGIIDTSENPSDAILKVLSQVQEGDLLPGDVLLVQGENGLHDQDPDVGQHSAIYVGNGLLMEKGDTDGAYPYRIVSMKDTVSIYKSRLESPNIRFFRLKPGAKVRAPRQEFSITAAYPSAPASKSLTNYVLESVVTAGEDVYSLSYILQMKITRDLKTLRYILPESDAKRFGITSM